MTEPYIGHMHTNEPAHLDSRPRAGLLAGSGCPESGSHRS